MSTQTHIEEQLALAEALRSSASIDDAFAHFSAVFDRHGFPQTLYAFFPLPTETPELHHWIMLNSYSDQFCDDYVETGMASHDKTVKHCFSSNTPLRWNSVEMFDGISKEELAVEQLGWDHGLLEGLVIPLAHGGLQGRGGIGLSATGRTKQDLTDQLRDQGEHLTSLVQIFHSHLLDTGFHNLFKLTERQREIVRMLALGYNDHDIGEKLHISHRTSEKHRKVIRDKLRAVNDTQVVAKSIVCNLISM